MHKTSKNQNEKESQSKMSLFNPIVFILVALLAWVIVMDNPGFSSEHHWTTSVRKWVAEESDLFLWRNAHSIWYKHHRNPGKPIVLLLHGYPTSSYDWNKVWYSLKDRYELIAVDFMGFGVSDKPSNVHISIMEQANLVEALISSKKLGLDKGPNGIQLNILAHDYGDSVAQELMCRQRDKVLAFNMRSVTLLNGGIIFGESHPIWIQKVLEYPIIGSLVSKYMLNTYLFRHSMHEVCGPNMSTTMIDEMMQLIGHKSGNRIQHQLVQYLRERQVHEDRWRDVLKEKPVATRLIIGPKDPVSGRQIADAYGALVRDADIVTLDHTIGHYPQLEDTESVVRHFVHFVDKHNANTAHVKSKEQTIKLEPAKNTSTKGEQQTVKLEKEPIKGRTKTTSN